MATLNDIPVWQKMYAELYPIELPATPPILPPVLIQKTGNVEGKNRYTIYWIAGIAVIAFAGYFYWELYIKKEDPIKPKPISS